MSKFSKSFYDVTNSVNIVISVYGHWHSKTFSYHFGLLIAVLANPELVGDVTREGKLGTSDHDAIRFPTFVNDNILSYWN